MTSNREWMYTMRLTRNGAFNTEFRHYVNHFFDFAYTNATNIQHSIVEGVEVFEIRCPCKKCKNRYYKTINLVELHLCQNGFMEDYMFWYAHGELYPTQEIGQCSISETAQDNDEGVGDYRRYEQMIIESMHQPEAPYYQQAPYCQQAKQNPNQSARTFYKMLNQVSEPLWDGSKKASTLSTTTSLIAVNTCFLLRPPPIDTSIDASHPLSKTLNLSLNSSALESKHPTINLHRLTFGFSFLVSNFSEKIGSPHYPQSLNIVGMECRLILRSSTSARFKATCETIKFGCSKEAKSCTQGQCYIHIRCVQTPCIQKSRRRKI